MNHDTVFNRETLLDLFAYYKRLIGGDLRTVRAASLNDALLPYYWETYIVTVRIGEVDMMLSVTLKANWDENGYMVSLESVPAVQYFP